MVGGCLTTKPPKPPPAAVGAVHLAFGSRHAEPPKTDTPPKREAKKNAKITIPTAMPPPPPVIAKKTPPRPTVIAKPRPTMSHATTAPGASLDIEPEIEPEMKLRWRDDVDELSTVQEDSLVSFLPAL